MTQYETVHEAMYSGENRTLYECLQITQSEILLSLKAQKNLTAAHQATNLHISTEAYVHAFGQKSL